MLPPITNPKWKDLVLGNGKYQFQLLATRIMISRLTTSIKIDPSPENIERCIKSAYEFFEKNEKISQADLKQIFG